MFHGHFDLHCFLNRTHAGLSVTSHINCIVAHCLINVIYITACAFNRSWWRCTFKITSLMTLISTKIKNCAIITSLKREEMRKLINRIPGSSLLISSLPGSALRTHVESLGNPCDVNKGPQSLTCTHTHTHTHNAICLHSFAHTYTNTLMRNTCSSVDNKAATLVIGSGL